jgi:integrase
MAVRKQCSPKVGARKFCEKSPRCEHEWWLDVMHMGERYRMPVNDFAIPRMKEGERYPVTSRHEAEKEWEPLFIAEIVAGRDPRRSQRETVEHRPIRTIGETVRDYRDRYAKRLADQSVMSQLKVFEERWDTRPLRELESPTIVEDLIDDLLDDDERRRTQATVNRYLARLRHFINWCRGRQDEHGHRWLTESPFFNRTFNPAGIKVFKEGWRHRRLQDDEETRLVQAFEKMDSERYWFAGELMLARFHCALDTGLRRGEMLKLQRQDVLWKHNDGLTLLIRWGNAKSRKERLVPVTSERLREFLEKRRFAPYPFGDEEGGKVDSFRTAWETALALAKITDASKNVDGDLRWHDLRHEAASRLAEQAMPVDQIQKLLGHSSLNMTQRYLNPGDSVVRESMTRAHRRWA